MSDFKYQAPNREIERSMINMLAVRSEPDYADRDARLAAALLEKDDAEVVDEHRLLLDLAAVRMLQTRADYVHAANYRRARQMKPIAIQWERYYRKLEKALEKALEKVKENV